MVTPVGGDSCRSCLSALNVRFASRRRQPSQPSRSFEHQLQVLWQHHIENHMGVRVSVTSRFAAQRQKLYRSPSISSKSVGSTMSKGILMSEYQFSGIWRNNIEKHTGVQVSAHANWQHDVERHSGVHVSVSDWIEAPQQEAHCALTVDYRLVCSLLSRSTLVPERRLQVDLHLAIE